LAAFSSSFAFFSLLASFPPPSDVSEEARNSVAHTAMHRFFIAEQVLGLGSILPADLLKPIPVYTRSRLLDIRKTASFSYPGSHCWFHCCTG
jgi:hypothetical protein